MKQKPMQNTKLQETKVLQPAVVFRNTTAPSKQTILDSRSDRDYQVLFARTTPNEINDDFVLQTIDAHSFADDILANYLTIGCNPQYREMVESNPTKVIANNIKSMQGYAATSAANKYRIAIEQNVNYCISDAIGCLIAALKSYGKGENAINMITNAFSFATGNTSDLMVTRIHNNAFYTINMYGVRLNQYIEMIGKSANADTDKPFDDACLLAYNSIVADTFSEISAYVVDATRIINQIVYSPDSDLSLNDASNSLKLFSDIFAESLGNVADVIQHNAYALLNDIILISQTLYGDAEFKNVGYDEFMYEGF